MTPPRLETERLILRAHAADDLVACLAMWSDERVYRHITGVASTEPQVWARILAYRGLWALLGYGYWAVEEKSSGRFVGEMGFADFRRELTPSIAGEPELGWVLAPDAHGKGYATEVLRAVLAWGDRHLGRPRAVCLIAPGNTASLRVAEKAGFLETARTTYKGEPTILFARALPA
jgi:RimJ/RimL family protein N-acetyltransferase